MARCRSFLPRAMMRLIQDLALSPTTEEGVTALVASSASTINVCPSGVHDDVQPEERITQKEETQCNEEKMKGEKDKEADAATKEEEEAAAAAAAIEDLLGNEEDDDERSEMSVAVSDISL